jgi:NTP pyrophosphatase (non-canonical NTP hydrolase)
MHYKKGERSLQRASIYEEINKERAYQNSKHPDFPPQQGERLAILVEEVGEIAKGIQDKDLNNLRYELIQVAAVCVRWIEALNYVTYRQSNDDMKTIQKE